MFELLWGNKFSGIAAWPVLLILEFGDVTLNSAVSKQEGVHKRVKDWSELSASFRVGSTRLLYKLAVQMFTLACNHVIPWVSETWQHCKKQWRLNTNITYCVDTCWTSLFVNTAFRFYTNKYVIHYDAEQIITIISPHPRTNFWTHQRSHKCFDHTH